MAFCPDVQPDRPRSGRPPATTRAELEKVAFRLFEQNGFDETSVDQIAEAAGIARRTSFHYSPSTADLVWGSSMLNSTGRGRGWAGSRWTCP